MKVLVLGGYGLIGLEILRRLHEAGHDVTGLGRSAALGRRLFPGVSWIGRDIAKLTEPEDWRDHLKGFEVVINASGALQEGARDHLAALQHEAVAALIAACEGAGVTRFVQISAPGAVLDATTEFMRSKARADHRLKASALDWVILRPGLVIGPGAYGGTALIRMLAGLPAVQPLVFPDRLVRTVALSDVGALALLASEGGLRRGSDLDLVAAEPLSLGQLVDRVRVWLGFAPPRVRITLPDWLGFALARLGDALGYLGWRPPLRTTALRVLSENPDGDPQRLRAVTGAELLSLDETLQALPATLQERWFARLYLALPLMIATLTLFWILSGAIALLDVERAAAVIPAEVLSPRLAAAAVVAGALVDMALGAAVLVRPLARAACGAMILVTLLYLAGGTLLTAELWTDPLGPLLKTLPAIVLALVAALLLEER